MKKSTVWKAFDGKEFEDRGACESYELSVRFKKEAQKFFAGHLPGFTAEQSRELVEGTDDLWEAIQKDPDGFQEVLDHAKPKPRRGRPPGKGKAKKRKRAKKKVPSAKTTKVVPEDTILGLPPQLPPDISGPVELPERPPERPPPPSVESPPPPPDWANAGQG